MPDDVRALPRDVVLGDRQVGRQLRHAELRRQVAQVDAVGAAAQIERERAARRGQRDEPLRGRGAAVGRGPGVERDAAVREAAGGPDVARVVAGGRDRAGR